VGAQCLDRIPASLSITPAGSSCRGSGGVICPFGQARPATGLFSPSLDFSSDQPTIGPSCRLPVSKFLDPTRLGISGIRSSSAVGTFPNMQDAQLVPTGLNRRQRASAGANLLVSMLAAALAGGIAVAAGDWQDAGLIAWVAAAAVFLIWTWTAIWPLGSRETTQLAQREDSSRAIRDIVLLVVSVGAMLAVALVIFQAHQGGPVRTTLGVACVAASWLVVHTIFALRYTRLYYADPPGGLDFQQDAEPTFRDFAYVAFTVGMTFQISDTAISKTIIRVTVLRHALISFVFGAVIIAVTINVVAGLSR